MNSQYAHMLVHCQKKYNSKEDYTLQIKDYFFTQISIVQIYSLEIQH